MPVPVFFTEPRLIPRIHPHLEASPADPHIPPRSGGAAA